jgi:hypothetical protein
MLGAELKHAAKVEKHQEKQFRKYVKQELKKEITKLELEKLNTAPKSQNVDMLDDLVDWVSETITMLTAEDEPVNWIPGVTRVIIDGDNCARKMRKLLGAITFSEEEDEFCRKELVCEFVERFSECAQVLHAKCICNEVKVRSTTRIDTGVFEVVSALPHRHSSLAIVTEAKRIIDEEGSIFHHVFLTSDKRLTKILKLMGARYILPVKPWVSHASSLLLECGDKYEVRSGNIILLLQKIGETKTQTVLHTMAAAPNSNDNGDTQDYLDDEPGLDDVKKQMEDEMEINACAIA